MARIDGTLVMEISGVTLSTAIADLRNPTVKYNERLAAKLWRKVVPEESMLAVSEGLLKNSALSIERIEDIDASGQLFAKITSRIIRPKNKRIWSKGFAQIFEEKPGDEALRSAAVGGSTAEELWETFFESNNGESRFCDRVYARDVELDEDNILLLGELNAKKSTPADYKNFPGSMRPMLYASSAWTSTAIHTENKHMPGVNIHRGGAPKCWLTVAPKDMRKLERCVGAAINASLMRQDLNPKDLATLRSLNAKLVGSGHLAMCPLLISHGHYFVSPSMLRSCGIEFQCFFQCAGDMVVVQPCAFHAVLNTAPSLAEAVNYDCGVARILFNGRGATCECPESNMIGDAEFSTRKLITIKTSTIVEYVCRECTTPFATTPFATTSKLIYEKHLIAAHRTADFKCVNCPIGKIIGTRNGKTVRETKLFPDKSQLKKHQIACQNRGKKCPKCRQYYKQLEQHMLIHDESKVSCANCDGKFKTSAYAKHRYRCLAKTHREKLAADVVASTRS